MKRATILALTAFAGVHAAASGPEHRVMAVVPAGVGAEVPWYGTSEWLRDSAWDLAVRRDRGEYITEYATTSSEEDYAESFAAWVIWRAYGRDLANEAQDGWRPALESADRPRSGCRSVAGIGVGWKLRR